MSMIKNASRKALALLVSALLIISMLPVGMLMAATETGAALVTDIEEKTFYTGQATEFTYTTIAGDDAGKMVLGSFTLLNESGEDARDAVALLEYWDVTGECFREFYGNFGPPTTGFPLTDATSRFRVTFSQPGTYTVKAAMINFADGSVLVAADDAVITVAPYLATLTTDITTKKIVNNVETEFTYTTTANGQAGAMVLGTFSVLDSEGNDAQNCITKLEYWDVTGECFREFYGDFGPPTTGFPLTDATSRFRVTFCKEGTYTVQAAMINFADRSVLTPAEDAVITVAPFESALTTDIDSKTFINNNTIEFTYTTTANGQAGTMVWGTFSVQDSEGNDAQSCITKLEYWDVTGECFREFYGDFGPPITGFPLTDATSRFRVTFNKPGDYTVSAAMKKVEDGEWLCSNVRTITVLPQSSELTTNITEKNFEINDTVEFTYTTIPNDYLNTMVWGTFSVLDSNGEDAQSCITKLEYWDVQNSCFREFYGKFGPPETGFPLMDATSTFRVSFHKTGSYTVVAQMVAVEGGAVLSENITEIEVKDTIAPIISEVKGNVTNWINTDVTLEVIATDNSGAVVEYRVNEEEWQESPVFTITENGEYFISARDAAGNVVTIEEPIQVIYIDKQAPVIGEFTIDPEGWTNNEVTFTIIATDEGIGSDPEQTDAILYQMDGTDEDKWQTPNIFTIADNLEHVIYVKDSLGNLNETPVPIVAGKYDATPPVIHDITQSTDVWVNDQIVITVNATDEGVGSDPEQTDAILYRIDGMPEGEWQTSNTFTITENGEYCVYAKDLLGNESELKKIEISLIDKTPAEIVDFTSTTEEWTNQEVEISGKVEDAQSGVLKIEHKVDGDWEELQLDADNKFSITITDECDSTHYFRVYDVVNNESMEYSKRVRIDKTAPNNVTIQYTEPVQTKKGILAKLAEILTFGFYNAEMPLEVTVNAEDTSLDKITIVAVGTKGRYNDDPVEIQQDFTEIGVANVNTDINVGMAQMNIPSEFMGTIYAIVYDKAGNTTTQTVNTNAYDNVIVDEVSPEIEISYSAAANTQLSEVGGNYYYDGAVTATIKVTENNFFEGIDSIHELGLKVTATDNEGHITTTEYLPVDTAPMYVADQFEYFEWQHNGITHTYAIALDENADYVVEVQYVDYADNDAIITDTHNANDSNTGKYVSNVITVDTIAPEVTVEYADQGVAAVYGNREYFTANRYATITVNEHNFRASDFAATVTALYSDGSNVAVEDFAKKLATEANWTHIDDIHTIQLDYIVDANYTFDFGYQDLAKNAAADYAADEFTVDKVDPQALFVTYDGDVKTTILDKLLNVITFGYYDAKVQVTISATDDVSSIDHFVYSYIKADGVSGVNASLENVIIGSDAITQTGKTFTAKFEIPKDVLQNTNQFNGTVNFTAFERSTRKTEHQETATIIVDNIAPTATITYNVPVQTVNDISYYDGNIDATIVIDEANFNSEEVIVKVNGVAVDVLWTDNSVDTHTGTFTLTEDNDYIVTVEYSDRSKNAMTSYTSNQLTIDTKDPVIQVSNVKHQSANNAETISLTVSVTDTNIPLDNFKPVLNAVIKKENGNNQYAYETQLISLGTPVTTTNANGETVYTYTVNNLEVDGYYSLVCSALDYANHNVSIINSAANEGGSAIVETVNFSVNRGGSVFWIETEHNDKYGSNPSEMYKDTLNGAYANDQIVIKLHELNVDKVDVNADKKTVLTLNDGNTLQNIELVENQNYSKNVIVGTGGWYETVYTLDNSYFNHDGVYSLSIVTYDMADNGNVNTKNESGTISFTLDRTNPVIAANVSSNQRVKDSEFWVEFEITEANLNADTVQVILRDREGNEKVLEKSTQLSETRKETLVVMDNNEYKFLLNSGYGYSVEIMAEDMAGNKSEIYTVDKLTITTNVIILWYANTPLFWSTIGGAVLIAGLIVLLVVMKKNKDGE